MSAPAGGIFTQNSPKPYPRIQSIVVKNSSFDTSRYTSGPIRLNGGNGSTQTITADEQASYGFAPNPDGSGTAYTDANGQTQNVKAGALTEGDTWVGAWWGDQTKNNSSDLTLITRNTGVGLMGEQYTTGSGDGKLSYIQFPLSSLTKAPSQATLHLTYVGHRYSSVPSTDTDQLLVQPVSDTTCTGGGTSCPINTMTWQNRPSFTATSSSVAKSATFTLGSTIIPEGGGTHQGNAIDGRDITVDITSFVQNAYAANQSTLLLAVGNAGGTNHELRFVSSEGATGSGKLTNGNAEMAPALTVTP
ncbi:DNRLRE domain-containing protein [Nonomuraea helvata]|uniref:DNRLRE domain-containing protein n=1 Tax=Nonomuraea helvata TaxID=37484 RepID=A0ABV5SIU8_9ACTN